MGECTTCCRKKLRTFPLHFSLLHRSFTFTVHSVRSPTLIIKFRFLYTTENLLFFSRVSNISIFLLKLLNLLEFILTSHKLWYLKDTYSDKEIRYMTSVQFSHSVVSDSLWPHGLQHARFPCSSSNPGTHSNLCPSSQWFHATILSSVIPFSLHLQSFPASGSFPVNQFFTSGGQSSGVSAFQWIFMTDFL